MTTSFPFPGEPEHRVPVRAALRPVLSLSGAALLALARDVLARGAQVRFRARGSSMSPFIRDRDILTLAPVLTLVGSGLPACDDAFVRHQPGVSPASLEPPIPRAHPDPAPADSRGAGPPACDHRPSGRWRRARARLFPSKTASHNPPVAQTASNQGPKADEKAALAPATPPPHIHFGDVLAFDSAGRLIVHRLVRIAPGQYLLKGDNNPQPDGWFPADAILGRVVRVERAGRRIRLGLGPERALIAVLSRRGALPWLFAPLRLLRSLCR
jgi:hypothetical protein